jgi:hypothetical protein
MTEADIEGLKEEILSRRRFSINSLLHMMLVIA